MEVYGYTEIQTEETIETEMHYPPLILSSSISTLLPFLASIVILRHFSKYSKRSSALWIFFALAVATEITLFVLNAQRKQSTWIFHAYTLIEYVLITIVLASWQAKPTIAKVMRISVALYILLFILIKVVGLESFSSGTNNYITRPFALLLLSTFAFLTVQDLWRNSSSNLTDDYRFWMLLAMALYYSTSLGLFAFMFTKNQELLIALFKIHAVVNIIHNLLFTIGVFKVRAAQQVALQPTSAS